jgi:hypothetical protein
VQQVQRMGHRLARDAEPIGQFVLGNALSGQQGAMASRRRA